MVQAFNAGRYLVFVVFFLAFAAGMGTRVLLVGRRSRQDRVLALLLLAWWPSWALPPSSIPIPRPGLSRWRSIPWSTTSRAGPLERILGL